MASGDFSLVSFGGPLASTRKASEPEVQELGWRDVWEDATSVSAQDSQDVFMQAVERGAASLELPILSVGDDVQDTLPTLPSGPIHTLSAFLANRAWGLRLVELRDKLGFAPGSESWVKVCVCKVLGRLADVGLPVCFRVFWQGISCTETRGGSGGKAGLAIQMQDPNETNFLKYPIFNR